MIAVTIDSTEVVSALNVIGENLANLREPLTELLTMGLRDAHANLLSRGTLYGEGWAPMSPWTEKVAQTLYGKERDPSTLLEDTGALAGSLLPEGDGNFLRVEETSGEAGSALVSPRTGFPIAVGMQRGTSRTFHVLQGQGYSETGIPARRFLEWHDVKAKDYVGIFAEHAFKGLESSPEGS